MKLYLNIFFLLSRVHVNTDEDRKLLLLVAFDLTNVLPYSDQKIFFHLFTRYKNSYSFNFKATYRNKNLDGAHPHNGIILKRC